MIRMDGTNSVSEISGIASRTDSRAGARDGKILWGIPGVAVREEITASHVSPWWLWWNILSLDAPAVAVVWSLLVARQSHVTVRPGEEIILGLVVWGIYVSDRLLDGYGATQRPQLQARHLFCAKHREALACIVVLATGAVLWAISESLTLGEATAGLKLSAVVGAYMAGIHAGHRSVARFVPKEAVVGILFAAGTTLPVWTCVAANTWNVWATFSFFAVLCIVNCLAIECWESRLAEVDACKSSGWVIRWADARIGSIAAVVAASAFIVVLLRRENGSSGSELLAISLAALLICFVNIHRSRISVHALRVLADAALVVAGLIALMTWR